MPEKESPKGDQIKWYRMTFESEKLTRVIRLQGTFVANDLNEARRVAIGFAKDHNLNEWPEIKDVTEEVTRGKPIKKN